MDFLKPMNGNGSGLTALNAAALATGVVAPPRLGAGTASATTFLRGDQTWAAPAAAAAGVGSYAATIGDGVATSFTVTHGLGTRDVVVAVRSAAAPYDVQLVAWQATTTTAVTVGPFDAAPTTGQYRVVILAAAAAAAPGGGLPTDIAGCKLWLDAGTLALADGAQVATWADSSGTGHDATQATAALRPIFKTNIINGKPAVRFDGNDDALPTAAAIAFSGGFTLFFVLSMRNVTADQRLTGHPSDLKSIHLRIGGSAIGQVTIFSGSAFVALTGTFAIGTTAACQVTVTWDGSQVTARVNGVAQTPAAVSGLTWPAGTGLGHVYPQAICPDGDIAEAILYNVALAAADRQAVEDYLKAKFGIP